MAAKKNLYELLDVPINASNAAIERAYDFKQQLLEDRRASMSQQDYDYRLKVLSVVKQTLLDPMARHQYDHKLMAEKPITAATAASALATGALVKNHSFEQQSTRAHAMSLQADALHLRADALAILAAHGAPAEPKNTWAQDLLSGALAPFKRIMVLLGVLVFGWTILQMTVFYRAGSETSRGKSEERKMGRAEEKAILQEHFQTYGERAATVEEAQMLAAAHQKLAQERREAKTQQEKTERDEQRFIEESRRRSEQVSRQLRDEEDRAQRQETQDKESDRRRAEEKERQERYRQEQQQREWRQILRR